MELEKRISNLPLSERNKINCLFCDIYTANEQEAFQQGLRFGFRLAAELIQSEEENENNDPEQSWTFPCPKEVRDIGLETYNRRVRDMEENL